MSKQAVVSVSRNTASIIANPDSASLKRIAWAFGCAKHGSAEETELRAILIAKIQQEPQS